MSRKTLVLVLIIALAIVGGGVVGGKLLSQGPPKAQNRPRPAERSVAEQPVEELPVSLSTAPLPPPAEQAGGAPQISTLTGLTCASPNDCWAVGNGGTLLATTDGGRIWLPERAHTDYYLSEVSCASVSDCWVVASGGIILSTTDGGHVWKPQRSGTSRVLYDASCPRSTDCFAVGTHGTILHTTDGGKIWQEESSPLPATLDGVSCVNVSDCLVVTGTPVMLWTTDAGASWQEINPSFPKAAGYLSKDDCLPDGTCVAVGDAGAIEVVSGGHVVGAATSPSGQPLYNVSCPSSDACVAVGKSGTILDATVRNHDGRASISWHPGRSSATGSLKGVSCPAINVCYAVGTGDVIVKTEDGGSSWVLQSYRTPPGPAVRVLLVGGSVALTLGIGLGDVQGAYDIALDDQGILGCGITEGGPIRYLGKVIQTVASACNGQPGSTQWPAIWASDIARDKPQVVVILVGRWETVDRFHDGKWMHVGEPAYDSYIEAQMRLAIAVASARGAKVVWLTSPYFHSMPPPPHGGTWPMDNPARVRKLNQLIREVASHYPNTVSVLDLNAVLDPAGKFAQYIDGVQVRHGDGVHPTLAGGELVAPWLLPRLWEVAHGLPVSPGTLLSWPGTPLVNTPSGR